jgi:hypothetical protein
MTAPGRFLRRELSAAAIKAHGAYIYGLQPVRLNTMSGQSLIKALDILLMPGPMMISALSKRVSEKTRPQCHIRSQYH